MKNSICVTAACLLLGATAPLAARTVQGDRYLAEGRASAALKQWDAALASYRLALAQDPAEMLYQMAAEKAAFQAADAHISLGQQARAQGRAAEPRKPPPNSRRPGRLRRFTGTRRHPGDDAAQRPPHAAGTYETRAGGGARPDTARARTPAGHERRNHLDHGQPIAQGAL